MGAYPGHYGTQLLDYRKGDLGEYSLNVQDDDHIKRPPPPPKGLSGSNVIIANHMHLYFAWKSGLGL